MYKKIILCGLLLSALDGTAMYQQKELEQVAIEYVREALGVTGLYTVTRLTGGLSGAVSMKVVTEAGVCVVRFCEDVDSPYFPHALTCQKVSSDEGYGPSLLAYDETRNIVILEYLSPEKFPNGSERLEAFAQLLKKIHRGPLLLASPKRTSALCEKWIDPAFKETALWKELVGWRVVEERILSVARGTAALAPCHGDFHPGNVIYTSGVFKAIDYVWAGLDDPFLDLAMVAIFNCATRDEEQELLACYLEREALPSELARLSLIKVALKILICQVFMCDVSLEVLLPLLGSLEAPTKNYMKFGTSIFGAADLIEFASSLLQEVREYLKSDAYEKDLALLAPR